MTSDPSRLDDTHDPETLSWVESANDPATDFPIQNLPFGRFRMAGDAAWRIGVAIGDEVLDLRHAGLIDHGDMRRLLRQRPQARRELRRALHAGLARGSPLERAWRGAMRPISAVEMGMPCDVGDYTDFYVGIHHATAVGRLFRPENPLLPNYAWVPIGYHGRASTVRPSGVSFRRPRGQIKGAQAAAPELAPTRRLDFELELGVVIGCPNAIGEPIPLEQAEDHVLGLLLLNDWSARDIQAWEYQPLGPFLSKSFASTVSPWLVTLEALEPFRRPFVRDARYPDPLPYLDGASNRMRGAIDIDLQASLQTVAMRRAGLPAQTLSASNFADAAFWSIAQLVTHHTVNGCGLNEGDLLGTGTLSGAAPAQAGSLLELTQGGQVPVELPNGERRSFLEDGDAVVLRARCSRPGFRSLGFGACEARVEAAL